MITPSTSRPRDPILIFETLHGSRAYGLARAASDTDLKGVIVGPRDWYFGPQTAPEQVSVAGDDHVRFELRKFFRLAIAANPTLIEVLWTDPGDHVRVTPAGQRLLDHRSTFLSKRVKSTFAGYALSQLKRIKTHRRWLLSPPSAAPLRADFGLPDKRLIGKDQLGAAESLMARFGRDNDDLAPNFLDILDKERRYRNAHNEWQQYQGWLKHRNPARAALEASFGYDSKHAMHLVRLQRMAIEILDSGEVRVRRPDRDELLAIRDGALSYDELLAECEHLANRIEEVAKSSTLPDRPDEAGLDDLCVSLIEETLECRPMT